MLRTLRNKKGFTLVELAIVLVIIGIILGAVLKGQELINNAKVSRLYNMYREMQTAMYTYYDRYGRFPGDDITANGRWGAVVTNGNGNGGVDTGVGPGLISTAPAYACTATGTEQCDLWASLRLSNIISGGTTAATGAYRNPTHPFGGAIAISYFAYIVAPAISANWVHFQNVPTAMAQTIDTKYDDGVWNTGDIRASAVYTGAAPLATFSIRF
jgi:prepilin-type N-terminal cleavage/methylation domain-containing protein